MAILPSNISIAIGGPSLRQINDLELTFSDEPIVAWRIWRVEQVLQEGSTTEARLASLAVDGFWEPRRPKSASCTPGYRTGLQLHRSPWPECNCGIWALKSRLDAQRTLNEYRTSDAGNWALGSVRLWGRVIDCARGYRAEHGYPVDLVIGGPDADELIQQIAVAYAVGVARMDLPPVEKRTDLEIQSPIAPYYMPLTYAQTWTFTTADVSVSDAPEIDVETGRWRMVVVDVALAIFNAAMALVGALEGHWIWFAVSLASFVAAAILALNEMPARGAEGDPQP